MHIDRAWLRLLGVLGILGATSLVAAGKQDNRAVEIALAVQQIMAGKLPSHLTAPVWNDVRAFYSQRNGSPAWVADRNLAKADRALQLLRAAPDDGLVAADYGEPYFARSVGANKQAEQGASHAHLADLDVRLTASVLALARDIGVGKSRPETLDRRWKNQRTPPDLAGTLNQAVDGDLAGWISSIRPLHPEYASLRKALADLYAIQKKGAWGRIPAASLKPGDSGPAVEALRQRLAATGFLTRDRTSGSEVPPAGYDQTAETAVRAFQDHHGIMPTGIADALTVKAMNVPIGAQIQQVAINLERWRWAPADFGTRHILVNIPAYRLFARENGQSVMTMRVVVGKAAASLRTPVFSAPMTSVIFSPYWNIPDTIAAGETAPAVVKDPAYLAKNNIDILRITTSGAEPVDPSSVDWKNPAAIRELAFRQRPGAQNALGHVKFLLENPFNIYLHDTPADNLFARAGRALSHGCIRLEEPEALAKYVLRDFPEWDDEEIRAAEHAGVEKPVKLKEPIPVHIVYFTAWVDEGGGLNLYPDVYRYDKK